MAYDEGSPRVHEFLQIDFVMVCNEGLPRMARIFTNDSIMVCDERFTTNYTNSRKLIL